MQIEGIIFAINVIKFELKRIINLKTLVLLNSYFVLIYTLTNIYLTLLFFSNSLTYVMYIVTVNHIYRSIADIPWQLLLLHEWQKSTQL